jgi:2-octaprenyl-6-methoxyphenol hydroxylase
MAREAYDVLVAGGGVAGLTAALTMADKGLRTLCIDKAPPPPVDRAAEGADLRTTAFLTPSVEQLTRLGVWPRLSGAVAPLHVMRLIDAGGTENKAREQADFAASEIQDQPFGWNAPNTAMRKALMEAIEDSPLCELSAPTSIRDMTHRDSEVLVRLSDGVALSARLLIGADGRDSDLATRSGIGRRRWGYGQKALVFAVRHTQPHDGVSTEVHRSGGPFTLVPLPSEEGAHLSAVVWMERAGEAARLMEMPDAHFEREAEARSLGVLGTLTLASRRTMWPIISQLADRLTAPRTALIAEAAHVVPPIGAQGLNMSLADIRALADLVEGHELGGDRMLDAYQRARWPAIAAHVAGIDALNRAAMTGAQPLRDLRRLGLKMLHGVQPLRRLAMSMGLGAPLSRASSAEGEPSDGASSKGLFSRGPFTRGPFARSPFARRPQASPSRST